MYSTWVNVGYLNIRYINNKWECYSRSIKKSSNEKSFRALLSVIYCWDFTSSLISFFKIFICGLIFKYLHLFMKCVHSKIRVVTRKSKFFPFNEYPSFDSNRVQQYIFRLKPTLKWIPVQSHSKKKKKICYTVSISLLKNSHDLFSHLNLKRQKWLDR